MVLQNNVQVPLLARRSYCLRPKVVLVVILSLIAGSALCAGTQTARGFDAETLASVLEGNSSAISNVRYTCSYSYELTPEGEHYFVRRMADKAKKDGYVPLSESERKERLEISVMDTRWKARIESKRYSSDGNELKQHNLNVWNGEMRKFYDVLNQKGKVGKKPMTMSGMRPENLGMCVANVPLHEYIRKGTAMLADNTLTVSSGKQRVVAHLDPSQHYWPARIELFQDGHLRMRYFDIKVRKYEVEGQTIFFPISGKIESFRTDAQGSEPFLLTTGTVTVEDISFNSQISDSIFDFKFPDGTRLYDEFVDQWMTTGVTADEIIEHDIDKMVSELITVTRAKTDDATALPNGTPEERVDQQTAAQPQEKEKRKGLGLVLLVLLALMVVAVCGIGFIILRQAKHRRNVVNK